MPTVVMYHEVAREPGPYIRPLGIWVDPDVFAAQVDHFQRHYEIVDLDVFLSPRRPRRALLITFDDGLASVLDLARGVLAPRGLPAVAFLNPRIVESPGPSLDQTVAAYQSVRGAEALGRALGQDGPIAADIALRDIASGWRPAERDAVRARLLDELGAEAGPAPAVIDATTIRDLAGLGVEIGNHTASHVHGRALTDEDVDAEIVGAKADLERLSGRPVRAFAVPYGHAPDLTPRVLAALRRSGHAATFLVHGRANILRPHPDVWFRVPMDQIGTDRLRGVLEIDPARRLIRHLRDRARSGFSRH